MQKEGDVTRAGMKRKRSSSDENNIENDIYLRDKRLKTDDDSTERRPLSELITRVSLSSPDSSPDPAPTDNDNNTPIQEEFGLLTPIDTNEDSCDSLSSQSSPWISKLPTRPSPFPQLNWASEGELWDLLCAKDDDSLSLRDPHMLDRHPTIVPRMRTVLLDWLSEVCEVYTLHKETFYLTIDYIDRYLSTHSHVVAKQQLQLIGVAALMIAAKVEEIYPPKVSDYAYVTDGACPVDEILCTEMIILKALSWNITPVTAHYWLNVFLQVIYHRSTRCHSLGFVYPAFSRTLYYQCIKLLDLCHLDVRCLNYSYSVLATTAIYLVCSKQLACMISGLRLESLEDCIEWMTVYWKIVQEKNSYNDDTDSDELPPGPLRPANVLDFGFSYHKHVVSMDLSDLAIAETTRQLNKDEHPTPTTPGNKSHTVICDMTPPPSSSKCPTTPSTSKTSNNNTTTTFCTPSSSRTTRNSAITPSSSKSLRSGNVVTTPSSSKVTVTTPSSSKVTVITPSSSRTLRNVSTTTPTSSVRSKPRRSKCSSIQD